MIIRIKNLRLRCIIGINEGERRNKQDVLVNVTLDFEGSKAGESDEIGDTVNYRSITKKIIKEVEESRYFLLEKLVAHILGICMEDSLVREATVEVDKPYALRFADSVSVQGTRRRGESERT